MIKVIIFDFGGVVYRSPMDLIFEETGKEFNIDPKVVKEESKPIRSEWVKGKISDEEFWKRLALTLKISDISSLKQLWDRIFIENCMPIEKTIEIIKKLKERGYKVALLSNSVRPHADYHIECKHYDLFSPVFLSYELGMRKPDREIYEHVVKKMSIEFEECIFIDDIKENLVTAKKLGMKTILFSSPEQLEKELKRLL